MRPMKRRAALALVALTLAACAAPPPPTATTAPPTPVPPPPTPVPAPPTTAPAPTTAPPTAAPPSPTSAPPTATSAPSPTPVPPTATAAPARKFTLQKGSKLTLTVNETFAAIRTPNDAVLTTSAVTGQLTVLPDGKFGPDSKVTIDMSTLESDDSDRDEDVRDNYLEAAKFKEGTFVPKEFKGLPSPLPANGPIKAQLSGDLTIHGVTKPVTFDVDGALDAGTFKGKAITEVKITDFGMKVPTLAILLRVEDRVRTQLDLVAAEQR
jgi:polyisoprenoid-binding protein YceI